MGWKSLFYGTLMALMNIPISQGFYSQNEVRLRHTNIPSEFTDEEAQHRRTLGVCLHDRGEYSRALNQDKERQFWSQSLQVVLFWDFKSRQARVWDQGDLRLWTVFSWLHWQILISLLKVSQNLWQEFLLEIKLFVSPSGSCKNANRYKRYFHFMQIFYIFFLMSQFFLIYYCKLQLMRNLCHHFTEFQLPGSLL